MSGNFTHRHHVEPRVKLHLPREEAFLIPLKYIDATRTTHTNLDVKQEKRIDDNWNIDGSRDLWDPWTGFTQFTLLEEKALDGYMWSRERLTRKQLTFRQIIYGQNSGAKWERVPSWRRSKSGHMKCSILITRENCEESIFIDPEDKEFKETIMNARKKLEAPVAPAMPCKIMKENCGSGPSNKKKDLRVFWKLLNEQGCVCENLCRIIMKTILQEKDTIHCTITIWFTNLF